MKVHWGLKWMEVTQGTKIVFVQGILVYAPVFTMVQGI